jgi:hypothetical protein
MALSTVMEYCSDAWRSKSETVADLQWALRKGVAQIHPEQRSIGLLEEHAVLVRDARSEVGEDDGGSSLAKRGLALTSLPHRVTDWRDPAQIHSLYCPDVLARVQDFTGATDVAVMDYKIRDGKLDPNAQFAGFYASFAHSDITPHIEWEAGIPENGRPWGRIRGRHFAIFNCWRAFEGNPVENNHLIFLDRSTVQKQDMVLSEGANDEEKSMIFRLVHSEEHRWCYFPKMTADEMVVFKQYDTREPDPGLRSVFHTAVSDPTCPPGKPARKSIEVRVICFFDEDPDEQRSSRFAAEVAPPSDAYKGLPLPSHWQNWEARSSKAALPATGHSSTPANWKSRSAL